MAQSLGTITEADILARVVHPEQGDFPCDMAHSILKLRFEADALSRMNELAEKNNRGTITDIEQQEMANYRSVGNLLNLLHIKARLSLQNTDS